MAFRVCVVPSAKDGLAGVIAIETSDGAPTVKVVEPEMDPDAAVIDVLPAASALASPALVMVAVLVTEEVQVAVLVRFCVVPLL